MDSSTGRLYPSHAVALAELSALVHASDAVEITGTPEAVQQISAAVRAAHKPGSSQRSVRLSGFAPPRRTRGQST